jgi:hypothetical protein
MDKSIIFSETHLQGEVQLSTGENIMKNYRIIAGIVIYITLLALSSSVWADAPDDNSIPLTGIEDTVVTPEATRFPILYGKSVKQSSDCLSSQSEDCVTGESVEFVDPSDFMGLQGAEVSASSATEIVSEDFEGSIDPLFKINTDSPYTWGVVKCYSTLGFTDNLGSRSVWVADTPLGDSTALDPCTKKDNYPANLNVTLTYGPFSLAGATQASLDFFYWLDSEANGDSLFWGASKDGTNFEGKKISGSYTNGPFQNTSGNIFSYNFESFDLTNVPVLGDLTGEPKVWIRFQFSSNGNDVTGLGAFLDQITIRKSSATRQVITFENFDALDTTRSTLPQAWLAHDNNGTTGRDYKWGSINCSAKSDSNAMWVAKGGVNGIDPCAVSEAKYPKEIDSWLIYGPFNLAMASDAWVDFYFRSDIQLGSSPTNSDVLWMWTSKDGLNYIGDGTTGEIKTPEDSEYKGYSRMRINLYNLRGERTVWIAFILRDNGDDTTGGGVYIDDVTVVMEMQRVYVPLISRQPTPTPTPVPTTTPLPSPTPTATPIPNGGFTFSNNTGNPVFIELFYTNGTRYADRSFPATTGPHTWDEIPPGTYDWLLSGTCPQGAGQIGSKPPKTRAKLIITSGNNNAPFNEGKNLVDCTGN